MKEITITMERYDELIAKEYAYEAMKHAVEENYPFIHDLAGALFFRKRSVEVEDKF